MDLLKSILGIGNSIKNTIGKKVGGTVKKFQDDSLRTAANVQRVIERPEPVNILPKFELPKSQARPYIPVAPNIAKNLSRYQQGAEDFLSGVLNLPKQIIEAPINEARNTAVDIGHIVGDPQVPQYSKLRSNLAKLSYNLASKAAPGRVNEKQLNIKNTPQEIVGNYAGAAAPYAPFAGGVTGIKTPKIQALIDKVAGKKLVGSVVKGAANIAPLGFGYGFLEGLDENKGAKDLREQLVEAAKSGTLSAAQFAVFGGAIQGGKYLLNVEKAKKAIKFLKSPEGQKGFIDFQSPVGKRDFSKPLKENELEIFGKDQAEHVIKYNAALQVEPALKADKSLPKNLKQLIYDVDVSQAQNPKEMADFIIANLPENAQKSEKVVTALTNWGKSAAMLEKYSTNKTPPIEDMTTGARNRGLAARLGLPQNMQEAQAGFIDYGAKVGEKEKLQNTGIPLGKTRYVDPKANNPIPKLRDLFPKSMKEAQKGFINFGAKVGKQADDVVKSSQDDIQKALKSGAINVDEAKALGLDTKVPQVFKTEKFNVDAKTQKSLVKLQKTLGLEKRDVRSFEEMQQMADELGTDPQKLIGMIQNGRLTDKEVVALGNVISTSAQRISTLSRALKKSPNDAKLLAQMDAEETLINNAIGKRIKGGTEAGRSVVAFKILANRNLEPAYWLSRAEKQTGKALDAQTIEAINDLIGKKDRLGLANFISMLGESSGVEKAVGFWKASLLTGLRTHEANVISNATMGGFETAKDLPAAAFDIVRSKITGTPRAKSFGIQNLIAQAKGLKKGAGMAKQVFTEGIDPTDLAKSEIRKPLRFGKTPGGRVAQKFTDFVFRTLGSEDKVFYGAAFERSLAEQARTAGINGKLSSKDVAKLMKDPTEEMTKLAAKDALYATFNNDNAVSEFVKAGKKAGGKELSAVFDFIAPFVRTPTNVGKVAFVDYTPVGGLKTFAQKLFKKGNVTDREMADAFGRSITGTGVIWLGAELAKRGLISGAASNSEAERAQAELENRPPNAIFINGQWKQIQRISPLGNLLLLGAAYQQSDGNLAETAFEGLRGFSQTTFLKGAAQGLQAINEPDRFGQSFFENILSGYIPTGLSDIARGMDDTKRQPDGIIERIQNRIPGARELLPSRISPLGEPTKEEGGFVGELTDPFNTATPSDDPLINEFKRVGYNLNFVGDAFGGQKLTRDQQREYQKLAGQYIKELVLQVMDSSGYTELEKDQQHDIIEKAVNAAKSRARAELKPRLGEISPDNPLAAEASSGDGTDSEPVGDNLDLGGKKLGSKTYTFVKDGAVKTITLDLGIEPPEVTGDTDFDKALAKRYKSKITTEINNVYDLYEAGQLEADEAKTLILALKAEQPGGTGTGGTGKAAAKKTAALAKSITDSTIQDLLSKAKSKAIPTPKFSTPNLNVDTNVSAPKVNVQQLLAKVKAKTPSNISKAKALVARAGVGTTAAKTLKLSQSRLARR